MIIYLNQKCEKNCMFDHIPYNHLNVDINNIDNYIKNCQSIDDEEIIKSLKTINHVFKYILNFI
jgi:hypothetical protein